MNREDFLIFGRTKETDSHLYIKGFFYVGFEKKLFPLEYQEKTIDKIVPQQYQPDNNGGKFIQPIIDEETEEKGDFVPPIKQPREEIVKAKSNLVLFIQAEAGTQLIEKIKESNRLLSEFSNDLYLYTMRLWVGDENNSQIKAGFTKSANSGSIPKNDFVMLRFEFSDNYKGYDKNEEDYNRMDFFNAICQNELALIETSARLAFDNSEGMGSWER
jgi:hypothetical protein